MKTRKMKDSGVEWLGSVPEGWPVERLQWHLEEVAVKNDPVKTTNVLSLTIDRGVIPYSEKGNVGNKSKEDVSQYKIAYPETIVANSMNILIGAVGLSKYEGCVSPVYYVFRARHNACIEFFNYLFQMPAFQKELRRFANGILEIRLRVSADDILKRRLAIPTIPEQRAIAAYLDERCAKIDAMVADAKKLIEEYKAWKASLIFEAVSRNSARSIRLRFCSYVRARLGWKGLKADEYVEDGYPFFSAFNIVNDKLDVSTVNFINQFRFDESPEIKLCVGDLLVVKDGAGIGKCAVIRRLDRPSTVNGSIAVITPDTQFDPVFFYYYFVSPCFKNEIGPILSGMGVPHLFQSDLKDLRVPCPGLAEQRAIAAYLDRKCAAIDRVVAEKEGLIADLEQYKKSLIFECVTGKREVA